MNSCTGMQIFYQDFEYIHDPSGINVIQLYRKNLIGLLQIVGMLSHHHNIGALLEWQVESPAKNLVPSSIHAMDIRTGEPDCEVPPSDLATEILKRFMQSWELSMVLDFPVKGWNQKE